MPRIRGPKAIMPAVDNPFLLNNAFYGAHTRGGKSGELSADLSVNWDEIFNGERPLALEIGFNRGRFITDFARQKPEYSVLGIEIQRRFCWRLANLLVDNPEAPLNLRLLWADAKLVTAQLLGLSSVQEIHINFPDPWWKKRHAKRRLVSTDFASDLVNCLKPGGEIWVKSDVLAIADEIRDALDEQGGLVRGEVYAADDTPFTHREYRCVSQGMKIHRFRYVKSK